MIMWDFIRKYHLSLQMQVLKVKNHLRSVGKFPHFATRHKMNSPRFPVCQSWDYWPSMHTCPKFLDPMSTEEEEGMEGRGVRE